MNNLMLFQDQEKMQDDESNICQNQQQNSSPPFTSEVWTTMQTVSPASLPGFIPTTQETTDVGLVRGAQNSNSKKTIEPLIQGTEGSNTVSNHEKSWPAQFSDQNGSSSCEISIPSMTETTLTTPFQGYSSMDHLGDGGDFGFSDGIGTSENLPHSVLSNIPDDPIHSSSFLEPVGQVQNIRFNTETSGGGISSFSGISNAVPAQFDDLFSAEIARDQFGNYGLNDRTTRGINSLYPMSESGLSGVVHGTLAGNNNNNYGALLSANSALTTISDVKIALERHALSRKRKNYSFEDTRVSGISARCTRSSFYPTLRDDPKVALIGSSTAAHPTSAASNDVPDGRGTNWSNRGAIKQGIGSSNMSNYNGFGRNDIISSSMLAQHTVIPESSVMVQTAQCSLAELGGANTLQSSASNGMEMSAIPHTEGYAVMDETEFDYDSNGNINNEIELDTGGASSKRA